MGDPFTGPRTSRLIREFNLSGEPDAHRMRRYVYRFSIEGKPIHYFAVGPKQADVPLSPRAAESVMRFVRAGVLVLSFAVAGASTAVAQDAAEASEPRVERVGAGWSMIVREGNEDCAFGTPFRFFHREGRDPSHLLIWFQGGGACWDFVSCSGMFDTSVTRNEPVAYGGIFDAANPANPFRDHSILFIPYCTGDVHAGDTDATYANSGRSIAHHGARNVDSSLRWAADHLTAPRFVTAAGASAGSYGAIFHAPRIARTFASARVVTIGDSGVPLLVGYPRILERWGAARVLRNAWNAAPGVEPTLERAVHEAATAPNMLTVTIVTSDRDAIQSAFYLVSGSPEWRSETYRLLDAVEAADANVRSFVVAGNDHGLLRTDAFHDYAAAGTRLADWISRLIDGDTVMSVRCAECRLR